MSYRSYMPWARSIISNDKKDNKSEEKSGSEQPESKDNTQDSGYRSRYSVGSGSGSSSLRPSDSSSASASSYRASSYRPSLTTSSYTPRDRSVSGERFSSSLLPPRDTKVTESTSYTRPSYIRSNSSLCERDVNESDSKKSLGVSSVYNSYNRYGRSPSKTVNYDSLEEKTVTSKASSPAPRTETSAFKYSSTPYTSSISSRFSATRKDTTPILSNIDANTEGRYTYRTRPQPAVKKLEIPVKTETNTTPTTPLSPTPLSPTSLAPTFPKVKDFEEPKSYSQELPKHLPCTISVVTRGTSPNPPSAFTRTRRSELAREIQRDVARPIVRPECKSQYSQTEKIEEPSRFSRYSTRTSTPWSSYLDRYSSSSSSYSPVSRYTSKFLNSSSTESPKTSSTMSSRPSRISIETANSKSTVTAADKLKDSINSLVATLQTSPLGTPIREIPTLAENQEKRLSPIKTTAKSKSPEKLLSKEKSKSPEKFKSKEKSKTPESCKPVRKSSSPEKIQTKSPEKQIKGKSPEKSKFDTKPELQIKRSQSKCDIKRSPSKNDDIEKISKTSSKSNIAVSKRPKDVLANSIDTNIKKAAETRAPDGDNLVNIALKDNVLPKTGSKTDICTFENSTDLSPKLKTKGAVSNNSNKDNIIKNQNLVDKEILVQKNDISVISLVPELKVDVCNTEREYRGTSPQFKPNEVNLKQDSLDRSPKTSRKPPKSPEIVSKFDQKPLTDSNVCSKLPPPSPKNTNIKMSNSLNAITKPRLINKDFRKSPLNMSETEDKKSLKIKAISAGNSPLNSHKPITLKGSSKSSNLSMPLSISKSKSTTSASLNDTFSEQRQPSMESNISSTDNEKSNVISNSEGNIKSKHSISNGKPQTKFIRKSQSSRHDSSSTSSGSSSGDEEEEDKVGEGETGEELEEEESNDTSNEESSEEKENEIENANGNVKGLETRDSGLCKETNMSNENVENILKSTSFNKSQSQLFSRTDSGTSEDPCSSLPVDSIPNKDKTPFDKPPLPPSIKLKEESTNKAASFLMRALAPVTNLFSVKNKHDANEKVSQEPHCDELQRSETFQSISEIHDEVLEAEPEKKHEIDLEHWLDKNKNAAQKVFKNRRKSKKEQNKVESNSAKADNTETFWFESTDEAKVDSKISEFDNLVLTENLPEETKTKDINEVNTLEYNHKNCEVVDTTNPTDNLEDSSKKWSRPVSCEIGWWMKEEEKNTNDGKDIEETSKTENEINLENKNKLDLGNKETSETNINEQTIVRKVFRSDSGEHSWLLDSTEDISEEDSEDSDDEVEEEEECEEASDSESESEDDELRQPKQEQKRFIFQRVESGERAWWMQSTDNVPEGISRIESNSSISKGSSKDQIKYRLRPQVSGERAWWMQSSDNVPEGIKRGESKDSIPLSLAENKYRIRHVESGEKAWWMQSNDNVPEGIQRNQSGSSVSKSEEPVAVRYRIRPQQSGERAWWQQSTENIPDGIKREVSNSSIPKSHASQPLGRRIRRIESGEKAWWMQNQDDVALNEGVKRNSSIRSITKPSDSVQRTESVRSTDSKEKFGRKIRRIESGEKAWWMESNADIPKGIKRIESIKSLNSLKTGEKKMNKIRPQPSGDIPWWLDNNAEIPEGITRLSTSSSESEDESSENDENGKEKTTLAKFPLTLGDRTSPDGLDNSHHSRIGRTSPYDNVGWLASEANPDASDDDNEDNKSETKKSKKNMKLFIGSHTNIDDILGSTEQPPVLLSPIEVVRELTERFQKQESKEKSPSNESDNECSSSEDEEKKASASNEMLEEPLKEQSQPDRNAVDTTLELKTGNKLDDVSLQLYKDGDYGSYLDLEASLSEQNEEFEGFHTHRKNSIVLRTQLSVRVHTIIEKLLNSEGRELRRALFSLKQIFQEDKDLVHEFVQNDGLACLVKVGSGADQNFQNYILRALGQVMLYVDGMNGVMAHNETIQWLYALISSNFRLVVKTALKLLLVFVEYKESNCMLLIKAIHKEDSGKKQTPWTNVMKLLSDYDTLDTELLVYACTLVNKTLNGLPDQDSYYDQVDALEEQGMEAVIQRYMSRQGTDLDLLRQFQIYEAVLHYEDGEEKGTPLRQLDEAIRKTLKNRKASPADSPNERRKSRRHSSSIIKGGLSSGSGPQLICSPLREKADNDEGSSSSSRSSPSPSLGGDLHHNLNGGSYADNNKANVGVTPALRRRRERAERQRSFIREQQESAAILRKSSEKSGDEEQIQNGGERDTENWQPNNNVSRTPSRQDVLMNAMNKLQDSELDGSGDRSEERKILQLTRENTVKDLTQKLANSNIVLSPSDDKVPRLGDMTGIISKAMEGLAKSKSKGEIKPSESQTKIAEIKKSETELHWENLLENMDRPLQVCDLDFTDLNSEDELDILAPSNVNNGIPPPPPPISSMMPPPPPSLCTPPAPPGAFGSKFTPSPALTPSQSERSVKKSKKTVKLFWKEVREDPATIDKLQKTGLNLIWDELSPVSVDTQKLEHLFESRAKDITPKEKQQESNKSKEIIVLDPKRSNAINIGMTKLPPPRSIKTAILKMDSTVMNREGIEKLFAMLPTEEERAKIQEAQVANPDIPLGSAEQFLLTLASISELPARLKLWAFKLDYENIEREVAEPVMDLKQGMQILKSNRTFRSILGTLLSIGIFLNGNEVKGFQIEYLAKVPEVKDTVHKHSLLHHLCHMVMEKFPDSTDLYSEIGAVTRASKVDFEEIANNIRRLESECKASWEHLKVIAKHDGASATKNKMSDFLTECAQRIILLGIIHRRVINRYHNFLLWLGTPPHRISETKPNEFCRIVSEFALEYRTTRERVLQQLEKKANHRERNKTRGKMITECLQVGKFRSKEVDRKDAELRQLLGGDISDTESIHGTWRRHRKPDAVRAGTGLPEQMDGDDEILESLVKTATKTPATRTTPRERKRTRHADPFLIHRSRSTTRGDYRPPL